jgi:hypothetical protein
MFGRIDFGDTGIRATISDSTGEKRTAAGRYGALHEDGKIEQWYSLQGKRGVVFIINLTDSAAAHEMLEKLPLGKAHMMSFELIPIGPLNPLRLLQGMQPKP